MPRPLRIAALVKQIPKIEAMSLGADGRLQRDGIELHMNDYCRRAVEYDEADSVVLGCAGMADFCHDVSEQVGVPIIDGVTAGVVLVESMIKLGLQTSTRSEYAKPLPKTYT